MAAQASRQVYPGGITFPSRRVQSSRLVLTGWDLVKASRAMSPAAALTADSAGINLAAR
jgi:hypothetical protein